MIENRSFSSSAGPLDDGWYNIIDPLTGAGVQVGEKTALKYLTVFACVSLIAGDLARLPLMLYRRFPNGDKERVVDHPLYHLTHTAPNHETTSYGWREAGQGHLLLWGNSYAEVDRTEYGNEITAIWPISDPGQDRARKAIEQAHLFMDECRRAPDRPATGTHVAHSGFWFQHDRRFVDDRYRTRGDRDRARVRTVSINILWRGHASGGVVVIARGGRPGRR